MNEQELAYQQDAIAFRRTVELELRSLKEQYATLKDATKAGPPWWAQTMIGIGIMLFGGWMGMLQVGQNRLYAGVETNRGRIEEIFRVAASRTSLVIDVEELKKRVLANESLAQRIPFVETQLRDIITKLDRLIEHRFDRRGALDEHSSP